MPLFTKQPQDTGPEDAEPIYDDPKALPTIAIWLLLACAMLFSALVAHQADPPPITVTTDPQDAALDAALAP